MTTLTDPRPSINRAAGHSLRRHLSSSTSISAQQQQQQQPPSTSPQPLHLVILGAPGAGKGTQTESILRKYEVQALVVGNLLRDEVSKKSPLGLRAASVMKAGSLLDDQTILQVIKPGLHKLNGTNWILDGYPRTPQQAHDLEGALAEWNESINLVVNLDVPDEVLIERIEARYVHLPSGRVYNTSYNPPKKAGLDDLTGEPLVKRMDDRPEIFQKRLDQFHRENEPIKAFYQEKDALVNLTGRTSAEIWPKLEKLLNERYPHIRAKAAPTS